MKRLVAVLMLLPCLARAQSSDDLERAKASFKAGAAAYGAGDYPAAIQALESAFTITPLPAIGFSLAQAERRQYFVTHERDHLERALRLFRGYVAQVDSGGRRADALDALAQLEPLAALAGESTDRPARVEPRRTRLMISTAPSAARVSIDGAEPSAAPIIREVAPGLHRVSVEATGYQAASSEVTAMEGELILDEIQLHELPGQLALATQEGALIYVDGHFASFGGKHVLLSLPQGVHRVSVAASGHQTIERELMIERAQTSALSIELPLTRQRQATRLMGVLVGASVASSIILAGVSLRAQRRADEFLDDSARGNVSGPELENYRDHVSERDRLRTASVATAASAAALLIATALLHQLDRPRVEQLQRDPVTKIARVRPLWLANGLGLSFRH